MMNTIDWSSAYQALDSATRSLPNRDTAGLDFTIPETGRLDGFARLCIRLCLAAGDESLGLVPGQALRLGSCALLAHALTGCETLAHALHRGVRYHGVLLPGLELGLRDDGADIEVYLDLPDASPAFIIELVLGVWLRFLQWLTGAEIHPVALDLRHPETNVGWPAARVFGCVPRYDAERYRLCFRRLDGLRPVSRSDRELRELLGDIRSFFTRLMPYEQRFSQRVQQLLKSEGPELSLTRCAALLKLSPASLRRRLAEEALSFKALKQEQRMTLARQALRHSPVGIGQLAEQLGYSELSSFTRSFRRYTGMSPAQYRNHYQHHEGLLRQRHGGTDA